VAVTQSTSPWIIAGGGTAGTPDPAVLTVQGVSGGTAVPVSLASTTITGTVAATQSGAWNVTNISGTITLPTGAATSALQTAEQAPVAFATATATKSVLAGAQYLSTQPTITTTQQGSLLTTARGELLVSPGVSGFAVTLASTTVTGSVAVTGTFFQTTQPISIASSQVVSGAYASGALASGAVVDLTNIEGVIGNATAPTKMALGGLVYNSTPLTLTNGQSSALQGDASGFMKVNCAVGCSASSSITGWAGGTIGTGTIQAFGATSGTIGSGLVPAVNAYIVNTNGNGSATSVNSSPVVIASDQAAVSVKAASSAFASGSIASGALSSGSISSGAAVSGAFVAGAITDLAHGQGTMTASVPVAIASNQSSIPVAGNAANGAAVSGNPNLIAGSDGTDARTVATDTGGNVKTINGASRYQLVAASATATALTGGGGGATGDYLSHCVVVPATTSPGVVTILDNTTAIYSFAGGASSVSNLVPFAIPVGANSLSGAWHITTGLNVSVTCTGKFT
jgi:hypothetical protein